MSSILNFLVCKQAPRLDADRRCNILIELAQRPEILVKFGRQFTPTSFVLPGKAVDRLRAAAGKIIMESPEFQRLQKDVGITVVPSPVAN